MAITQIPGWSDNIGENIPKTPLAVYMRVPLVNKCANLVANSAATAPLYLYNRDNQIDWLYRQPLGSLIRRVAKDLQLHGKSYVLKMLDGRNNVKNLRRLNPLHMQHDVIGIADGYPVYRYTYTYNHRNKTERKVYEHHEIVYIPLDSETNDTHPDVYPASVALGPGKVRAYLSVFGEKYFDSGAMPTTIVSVEGQASEAEMAKFEAWIKRRVSGIRKAFGLIALRTKVTTSQLNPAAKDLAIPELDEKSRKDVLDAFGVPEGMVEKTANYASADVANRQFWDMTTKPLVELIVDAFNEQLFCDSDVELRPALEELPVYQVDESRRSASFVNYIQGGMSLEAAMWTLGIEELPENIPLREPVLEKPEAPRALDSGDSESGFDESGDTQEDGGFKTVEGVATQPSMFTHLDKWKVKCVNQMRHKKNPNFDFESELIPGVMKAAIEGALSDVKDFAEIDAVFDYAVDLHRHTQYEVI